MTYNYEISFISEYKSFNKKFASSKFYSINDFYEEIKNRIEDNCIKDREFVSYFFKNYELEFVISSCDYIKFNLYIKEPFQTDNNRLIYFYKKIETYYHLEYSTAEGDYYVDYGDVRPSLRKILEEINDKDAHFDLYYGKEKKYISRANDTISIKDREKYPYCLTIYYSKDRANYIFGQEDTLDDLKEMMIDNYLLYHIGGSVSDNLGNVDAIKVS